MIYVTSGGKRIASPLLADGHLREKMTNNTSHMAGHGFPSPFELPVPLGCEGWEELYAPHIRFSEPCRAFEEGRF